MRQILKPDRLIAVFLQIQKLLLHRLGADKQIPVAPQIVAHRVIHQNRYVDVFRGRVQRQLFCKICRPVLRFAGHEAEAFCRKASLDIRCAVLQKGIARLQLIAARNGEQFLASIPSEPHAVFRHGAGKLRAGGKIIRLHIERLPVRQRRRPDSEEQNLLPRRKRLWFRFRLGLHRRRFFQQQNRFFRRLRLGCRLLRRCCRRGSLAATEQKCAEKRQSQCHCPFFHVRVSFPVSFCIASCFEAYRYACW